MITNQDGYIDITEAIKYYKDLSAEMMMNNETVRSSGATLMAEQFQALGLDNQELSRAITELAVQTAVSFNQDAVGLTLGLIKEENQKELYAANVDLAKANKSLIEYQQRLIEAQIRVANQEEQAGMIKNGELEWTRDPITGEITAVTLGTGQESLYSAQILAELEKADLSKRQNLGFDDNLFVKDVQFQSSLASYAVNSGSDTAQDAIDSLHQKMDCMVSRAVDQCPEPPVEPDPDPEPTGVPYEQE